MPDRDHEEEMRRRLHQMFGDGPAGVQFPLFGDDDDEPEPEPEPEAPDDQEEALERIREFSLKPREIRDHLDRYVIQQAEAKKVLSVAICDHYNHVRECLDDPQARELDYAKQNVILLGPTGVGKTYLVRCISKLIGVPFVKADATKFSETGYVGHDAEDLVRDLVKLADGNTELAQYGIIYIDEIDKIASRGTGYGGRDVSGRGVQINLLKLMEDTDVSLHSQTDLIGQMEAVMEMMHGGGGRPRTINTRHILFIVSGAFDKLGEQVKHRVLGSRIGFGHAAEVDDDARYLHQVQTADFIEYGFEPEFIGRLPVRVICEALATGDLEQILLQSEGSILDQYRREFAGYGITLDVTAEAIHAIAVTAQEEKTGARGLMTVLERLFRDFKFELPSTTIDRLDVDLATVTDPAAALRRLLCAKDSEQDELLRREVRLFAERFHRDYGCRLEFAEDAVAELVARSRATNKTIRALCDETFRDYAYGLALIPGDPADNVFTVTREAVLDPDGDLSRWLTDRLDQAGVRQRDNADSAGEES